MQNAIAIGCFVVLLLVGIPLAIKFPWRVAMGGPRHKVARAAVQTVVFVAGFAFYIWLLVSLGVLLDWLEAAPEGGRQKAEG